MEPHITCVPTRIPVYQTDEEGFLIFADGLLMAVISYLRESVDESLKGKWFLEAGFGPCSVLSPPIFDSPDRAQEWVLRLVQPKVGSRAYA
jgi:hypothetical protein